MFNSLLEEAGEFGFYQKCLTFGFLMLTMVLVSCANWAQIFILMVPPHRCKINENDTVYNAVVSSDYGSCDIKVYDSEHLGNDSETSYESISCAHGYVYDFSEKFSTFATEHNLVCDESWKMYNIHACYYGGAALGAVVAGLIADKYGRKRAYLVCVIINIVSDIATFFAPNVNVFAICRFFSSMGATNLTTVSFMLAMEYTGPRHRLINLGVWAISFTCASTTIPWIAHALNNWRYILAVTFVPSCTALIASQFIFESASWLMTHDRWDETARLIHSVSKLNGRELSLNYIERKLDEQRKEDLKAKEENKKSNNNDVKRSALMQTIFDLFGTPKRRKTTSILCLLWMIATLCYVGNNLQTTNLPFVWYIAFSIGGISEIPSNIINLFVLDKLGRRWTNTIFFSAGGLLGIIAGSFALSDINVFVLSMIVRLCFAASFDISFTFTSESFPTVSRGRGLLLVRAFGSVANAVSPFIVYLSEIDKLLPLTVLGTIAIFGAFLTLTLPETARQHLPHTLEDGENFGKDQPFCFCPFAVKNVKINSCEGIDNSALEPEIEKF